MFFLKLFKRRIQKFFAYDIMEKHAFCYGNYMIENNFPFSKTMHTTVFSTFFNIAVLCFFLKQHFVIVSFFGIERNKT